MIENIFCRFQVRLLLMLCVCAFVFACGFGHAAQAATTVNSPVILSDPSSTRAVAFDALTHLRDPFPFTSDGFVASTPDRRTRIMIFVLNLDLLAGEGANALSADAEDSAHKIYPLTVEYVGSVPNFEAIKCVIVRLNDNMNDLGDVLLRLNLHGVASNRVRLSVGHVGGTIQDDVGSVPTPAPATPPAPTPTPTPNPYTGPASHDDAVRFLEQASWGPTPSEIANVQNIGFRAWLNNQFNLPVSGYPALQLMPSDSNTGCPTGSAATCTRDNYSMYPLQAAFFVNSMYGQDQLRQRVAFALHKIIVVSGRDENLPSWMGPYLQTLDNDAFGNFRQILNDVTLNPAMGDYLDMRGNNKTAPNENYAREIMQLFSVGLDQLNSDGTPVLDAQGNRIPTYDQSTITNFARVFTGWNLAAAKSVVINGTTINVPNYQDPMIVANESSHDKNPKVLLQYPGAISGLPANQTSAQDLNSALDNIFNHPNVGPFICKQLIQQLVTSNPSPAYVQRVVSAFNDNGQGTRGDMKAVITAILLDPEARGDLKTDPNYGRLREPVQLVANLLRAFNAKSLDKTTNSDGVIASRSNVDFVGMDQDLFRPVTVFSYFPADYNVPGTTATGPEFGILSATTALKRANYINGLLYTGITVSSPDRPNGTSLDLSAMQALAANPSQLVDALDALMLHTTMSAAMRNTIITAVSAVPATNLLGRTQTAIYLVATSSQYQVER